MEATSAQAEYLANHFSLAGQALRDEYRMGGTVITDMREITSIGITDLSVHIWFSDRSFIRIEAAMLAPIEAKPYAKGSRVV